MSADEPTAPPRPMPATAVPDAPPPAPAREAGKEPSWLLAGSLLGGLGTLIAAVVSGLALFVGKEEAPAQSEMAMADVPIAKSGFVAAAPYTFAGPVVNHEGIRVSLPDQWQGRWLDRWHAHGLKPIPEGEVLGAGINAAPSIAQWRDPAAPMPGVFIGVSRDAALLTRFSPRDLLATIDLSPCLPTGPIEDGAKAGEVSAVIEHDCGSGVTWYSRAWSEPGRFIALLQVKLTSAEDHRALRRILTMEIQP